MPRAALLSLLRAHAARSLDAHESEMTAAILGFVETEERCAERSLSAGHLTGSAWIVDLPRRKTLLTHHRKLDKWLQLGGHADGELDLLAVALREAREESGLASVTPVMTEIFDVDRHLIGARGNEPAHWHYDLRFLFEADADEPFVITKESKALAWIELDRVASLNAEESLLRMVRKSSE